MIATYTTADDLPTGDLADVVPPWMADAACRDADLSLFFLAPSEQPDATAARYCDGCPVRTQCLDYATAHSIRHGIWGGLTPAPRREREQAAADER